MPGKRIEKEVFQAVNEPALGWVCQIRKQVHFNADAASMHSEAAPAF